MNGEELELSGSLPLGAVEALDPALSQFTLQPGDVLTFATDGVIEASNASKELFGFDRLRQISLRSAAAIAQQAQAFGQEDDITVLRVTFSGAPSPRVELLAASPAS